MASLAAGLVLTIEDRKGKKSTTIIHLPPNLPNLGRYQAIAGNWMDSVDRVIKGRIVYAGITFGMELEGGIRTEADPLSDVEEGARFVFNTLNGYKTQFRIPTFDETKIIEGTREVNLTDADVETLLENVIDGIDDDDTVVVNRQNVTDNRGEDIVALVSAKESFVRSRG